MMRPLLIRPLALGRLGQVTELAGEVPPLPSSESVVAAIRGERNAWGRVVTSTALRALLIMPGLAFAGARGKDLVLGSVLSSATITAFIYFFYSAKCDGQLGQVQLRGH